MKKLVFMMLSIAVVTMFCTSCSSDAFDDFLTTPAEDVQGNESVTLNFSPYTMEAMTRGAGDYVSIASLGDHLDLYIINGDETIVINRNKTDHGNAFSSVEVTLNKTKIYTLYAVAHKHSGPVTLADNIITFAGDAMTDTFFYTGTLTPATTTTTTCQMRRVVGMFYFWVTDELIDDVTKFKFTISGSNTKLNVATGASSNTAEWVKVFPNLVKSGDADNVYKFKVYIMSTDATSTTQVNINVQAFKADDTLVKERSFENVNIKNGYMTTYKGPFFTDADMTMSFTVLDWDELETQDI